MQACSLGLFSYYPNWCLPSNPYSLFSTRNDRFKQPSLMILLVWNPHQFPITQPVKSHIFSAAWGGHAQSGPTLSPMSGPTGPSFTQNPADHHRQASTAHTYFSSAWRSPPHTDMVCSSPDPGLCLNHAPERGLPQSTLSASLWFILLHRASYYLIIYYIRVCLSACLNFLSSIWDI